MINQVILRSETSKITKQVSEVFDENPNLAGGKRREIQIIWLGGKPYWYLIVEDLQAKILSGIMGCN